MIGVPMNVQSVAKAPVQPAIEEIEPSAMQMIGMMIGARAMNPLGSLPKLLRSFSYSSWLTSFLSSIVCTRLPIYLA